MARRVIAVDGIDGSRTRDIGRRVVDAHAAAGGGGALISVDEFRRPVAWGAPDKSDADRYYEDYFDLSGLDRCLLAFLTGAEDVAIPIYDAAAQQVAGETELELGGLDLLVVEGVFTLRLQTVANAPLVWLDASPEVATERILARDSRPRAVVEHFIEHGYFPAHRRYLAEYDPRSAATLVIDDDGAEPRVTHLAPDAPTVLRVLLPANR